MFHICPQEILAVANAYEQLRFLIPMAATWCKLCVNGTHKTCEDHANQKEELIEE